VIVKTVILIVFLLILMNLAMALFFMVKDRGQSSSRTARALTWRIGLSVAAFILLLVAYALGWIQPHGIVPPAPLP
jgi:hypothetical protein